ncbi:hypothetical protein V8C86DRAFT_368070 [Haematococcus lacustris]
MHFVGLPRKETPSSMHSHLPLRMHSATSRPHCRLPSSRGCRLPAAARVQPKPGRSRLTCSAALYIAGKSFSNRAQAVIFFKRMLSSYADGETIEPKHAEMLEHLLQGHPRVAEKVGPGIKRFLVSQAQVQEGWEATRCFWLERQDGSYTDFSYLKCVNGLQFYGEEEVVDLQPRVARVWDEVLGAMRFVVGPSNRQLARQALSNQRVLCPETGEELSLTWFYVQYVPPLTIAQLAERWLSEQGLSQLEDVPIMTHPLTRYVTMADPQQVEAWKAWHDQHGMIRLVSPSLRYTDAKQRMARQQQQQQQQPQQQGAWQQQQQEAWQQPQQQHWPGYGHPPQAELNMYQQQAVGQQPLVSPSQPWQQQPPQQPQQQQPWQQPQGWPQPPPPPSPPPQQQQPHLELEQQQGWAAQGLSAAIDDQGGGHGAGEGEGMASQLGHQRHQLDPPISAAAVQEAAVEAAEAAEATAAAGEAAAAAETAPARAASKGARKAPATRRRAAPTAVGDLDWAAAGAATAGAAAEWAAAVGPEAAKAAAAAEAAAAPAAAPAARPRQRVRRKTPGEAVAR